MRVSGSSKSLTLEAATLGTAHNYLKLVINGFKRPDLLLFAVKKRKNHFPPYSSMPSSCIIHHLTKDTMMIHLLNSALQCTAIKKLKKSKAYTKEKYGYHCLNGGPFKSSSPNN